MYNHVDGIICLQHEIIYRRSIPGRIGFLRAALPSERDLAALLHGLAGHGWVQGQDDGALVRVDCKRELTCESEANFDWESCCQRRNVRSHSIIVSPSGLASGP